MNFFIRFLATGLGVVSVSAVTAVFWWRSANVGPVQRGADLARARGCVGCHEGPGESPLLPRPFAGLDDVDPATLREWILDGRPQRLQANPAARFFLDRQAIRMPAQLTEDELRALEAYIRWLRPATASASFRNEPALFVAVAVPAFATAAPQPVPPRAVASPALSAVVEALWVSPQAPELKASPALVGRLRDTPHGYFRYVNRQFTQAICEQFHDVRSGFPDVNLHGDAHLEQYAVTSLGRGLTDFDDSARGPSFIDLVRFGVSLELVAREKGWPGEGRRAFGDFLHGYDEALKNPNVDSPPPSVVTRARGAFALDHRLALRRADAMIDADPVPAFEIEADSRDYVTQMLADRAGMPARFFNIKKAGRLKLGIGSALDERYLFRVEGWTKEADDDQILEAKLVRPLSGVDCVRTDQGPERVPLGMALIAYAPFPFSGLFARRGRTFWVHGWTDDYVELSIDFSFASPQDLRQVAYDVGIQLGRAHPKEASGKGSRPGLRGILLQATRKNESRIRKAIDKLAEATVGAWTAFREATASVQPPASQGRCSSHSAFRRCRSHPSCTNQPDHSPSGPARARPARSARRS